MVHVGGKGRDSELSLEERATTSAHAQRIVSVSCAVILTDMNMHTDTKSWRCILRVTNPTILE